MTSPKVKPPKLPVQIDNIPQEIKELKRWVVWDWWYNDKQKKWTKPPLKPTGARASSTDPSTWSSFSLAYITGKSKSGVGFVLGDDVGIVGIDLDECRDSETGTIHEPAASIIRELDTYAEISPSGRGVKLLCRAKLPENCRKANHTIGLEIYSHGRYFTITGAVLDSTKPINERQAIVDQLVERWMPDEDVEQVRPNVTSKEDEIDLARSALKSLHLGRSDGYWDWLTVGMSLHAISPTLLDDWDEWSRNSPKYSKGVCQEKWLSFGRSGVGPGTLYHFAKQDGWIAPRGWRQKGVKAAQADAEATIENYHREVVTLPDGSERNIKVAHTQKQIVDDILKKLDGWPKRVGTALFITRGSEVEYLPKPSNLFSWIRETHQVVWGAGDDLVTKEELHISLSRHSQEFVDIQEHPHFPQLEKVFYTCGGVEPGEGKYLAKMLDFFSPATKVDRELILAAIVTTFWGGPPGQRPAFLISAALGAGQGTGKSTLSAMIGKLTGGSVDLSAGMDSEEIKKRLLSGSESSKRVILLDNVKKAKFSDQGIESLMTSPAVSGHKMYAGSANRPNLLTWFITMNGPSLSRDLAQRCVNIVLKRPKHSGGWYEEASNFIALQRERIIEDIATFFQRDRGTISYPSRWGLWEREVLSRLSNPDEVATELRVRESINDDDQQTANEIEEYVTDQLKALEIIPSSFDAARPNAIRIHIPNDTITKWVNHAIGESEYASARNASTILTRLENSGLLFCLSKNPSRKNGRGWIYSVGGIDQGEIDYAFSEKKVRADHRGRASGERDLDGF